MASQIIACTRIGLTSAIIVLFGCSLSTARIAESDKNDQNRITSAVQLKHLTSTVVQLRGRYERILDYSTSPPGLSQRVQIRLKDGFGVALGQNQTGLRSKSEIESYHQKTVIVEGTLQELCLLDREGYFNTFQIACMPDFRIIGTH
ncbi:MAG: hypothetical protein KDK39_18115 [Leptospiraceae bacterium]|nr:hypothetical protein [Leptospiraceae bacterium]